MRHALSAVFVTALTTMATPAASQSGNVTIVYDVSGSMWGQIDGVAKVTIAREVLGDLLDDWPPARQFGLIAYGHRREGDCTDIEQVVPLGTFDAAEVRARINSLMPRGRTPLTDAVRMAAESMRYQDEPATVILVTDGLETCNADPCALAGDLAQAGVDFTAHVVGFDIAEADRAQVACIAEATGGLFLPADSAEELSQALTQVTTAEPVILPLTLRAVDARDGTPLPAADWVVTGATGTPLTATGSGAMQVELDPGAYRIEATAPGFAGGLDLAVDAATPDSIDVPLDRVLAGLVLRAVDAQTGAPIPGVAWTLLNTGTETSLSETATGDRLDLLVEPGDYRVDAAHKGRSGGDLVTASLDEDREVVITLALDLPEASVQSAAEIAAGSVFEVAWTGPDDAQDYITIVPSGAPEGDYGDYWRTNRGNPAQVTAPDALGAHELRYVHHETRRVLASQPVTLTPVSATLTAPDEAPAGSVITVDWEGPDNPQDYITIVEAGAPEGSYTDYWRTNRGSPAQVTAPDGLGNYELRYVVQQSGRTLASRPVTLTAVSAGLMAPDTLVPGGQVEIAWQGPDNPQDYITIVKAGEPEGSYTDYWRTNRGSPARLTAPTEPGDYELRYVVNQSGRTLASLPVVVGVGEISLNVLGDVVAGGVVMIEWSGPGRYEDFIQIVPQDAPDEATASRETRATQGSPLQLFAPPSAGSYEIRYRASDSGEVLARIPLEVN
ncbi:MAG: vWA domain-containing protein [Paracoccaceae bacterium]